MDGYYPKLPYMELQFSELLLELGRLRLPREIWARGHEHCL